MGPDALRDHPKSRRDKQAGRSQVEVGEGRRAKRMFMPWYLIAAMFAPSLLIAAGLGYVVWKYASRMEALETFRHDMLEGAIRRDAAAVQVGRIFGLRWGKTTASKVLDRELREAAHCRQENGDEDAAPHDYAARVLTELCERMQEELIEEGDKEDCAHSCNRNAMGANKNVINICDYCTDNKKKPRPKS